MLGAIIDSIAEAMTLTRVSRHTNDRVIQVTRKVTRGHNVKLVITYETRDGKRQTRSYVIAAMEAQS